jgi:SAM-dependent methyltransferase
MPAVEKRASGREQSYLEHGSTFVDRLRTHLVLRRILGKVPKAGGLRLLDVGCGYNATFLRALRPKLLQGTGIDSSVSEACLSDPLLCFALGTIQSELPRQPDNTFDLLLFISVLEHLWEPQVWLSHCHRVLKEDGVLMVHVPTWYAKPVLELSAFRFGTSPACEMDDHKMYYSKRDLWPMLVQAGFKPSRIRLSYTNGWMTLLGIATK